MDVIIALVLFSLALVLFSPSLILFRHQERTTGNRSTEKRPPLFPPDFFTPYCVCPKCEVEALHWIENANGYSAFQNFEVARICRECNNSWGQMPKPSVAGKAKFCVMQLNSSGYTKIKSFDTAFDAKKWIWQNVPLACQCCWKVEKADVDQPSR